MLRSPVALVRPLGICNRFQSTCCFVCMPDDLKTESVSDNRVSFLPRRTFPRAGGAAGRRRATLPARIPPDARPAAPQEHLSGEHR